MWFNICNNWHPNVLSMILGTSEFAIVGAYYVILAIAHHHIIFGVSTYLYNRW